MKRPLVRASACGNPAPTFAAALQACVPTPGIMRAPGAFKRKSMLLSFFRDDIDHTARCFGAPKNISGRAMDDFNPVDDADRRRQIQIVGSPAVRKAAFQILFPSVDKYSDSVISVNAHDRMTGIERTRSHGDARSVLQGFGYALVTMVFHFRTGNDSSDSRYGSDSRIPDSAVSLILVLCTLSGTALRQHFFGGIFCLGRKRQCG